MARPQVFSEEEALDRAMELFWKKGFKATSMRDLVKNTGVCSASLYKTFGKKEEIYAKALARYQLLMKHIYGRTLEEGESVREYLRAFFLAKIAEVLNERPEGCMVLNATTELLRKDEQVKNMLRANEAAQRNWIANLLQQGIDRGEFDIDMEVESMAHYLFVAFQGVTINSMTQDSNIELEPIVETILKNL